jgi:DNA-binding CsgD family transcriptional regulator
VVRGEPGVGKTALLDYLVRRASGFRVVSVAGIESEQDCAFAALHRLCGLLWDRQDCLADPRRDALAAAFGELDTHSPDHFLVGLAALNLLSEAATAQPVVCAVDDTQWLDTAPMQALAIAARRLAAGRVALIVGSRQPDAGQDFAGLPDLAVLGLAEADAGALLDSQLMGPVDPGVRDRMLAATRSVCCRRRPSRRRRNWPAGCRIARDLWDHATWSRLSSRLIGEAYRTGELRVLPGAMVRLLVGDFAAAARLGHPERGYGALGRLDGIAAASESDWVRGLLARSQALVTGDETAEEHYRTAISVLDRAGVEAELARARLPYGEWLRRRMRRRDAREQLREAHQVLAAMRAAGFAERARGELMAAGETVRWRVPESASVLAAGEVRIARLATDGFTNPEIGVKLFLRARTVEWHLRKVYIKLGVSSRRGLRDALPGTQQLRVLAARWGTQCTYVRTAPGVSDGGIGQRLHFPGRPSRRKVASRK